MGIVDRKEEADHVVEITAVVANRAAAITVDGGRKKAVSH